MKLRPDFELTKDPYLALTGEPWVSSESWLEKRDRDISGVHCNRVSTSKIIDYLIVQEYQSIGVQVLFLNSCARVKYEYQKFENCTYEYWVRVTQPWPVQAFDQAVELSVIWDAIALIWSHCGDTELHPRITDTPRTVKPILLLTYPFII